MPGQRPANDASAMTSCGRIATKMTSQQYPLPNTRAPREAWRLAAREVPPTVTKLRCRLIHASASIAISVNSTLTMAIADAALRLK